MITAIPTTQAIAKVFQSGNSQAVRLPKAYRIDTDKVFIEKVGDSIVLTPTKTASEWEQRVRAVFASMSNDDDIIEIPQDFIDQERAEINAHQDW